MTLDFLVRLLDQLDAQIDFVEVTERSGGTFVANLAAHGPLGEGRGQPALERNDQSYDIARSPTRNRYRSHPRAKVIPTPRAARPETPDRHIAAITRHRLERAHERIDSGSHPCYVSSTSSVTSPASPPTFSDATRTVNC